MKKRKINEELYNDINYEVLWEITNILKENNNNPKSCLGYYDNHRYTVFRHILEKLKTYQIERVTENNIIILENKYEINLANEDKIRKIIEQSIDRVFETIMINTKCDKNDIDNSAEKKKFRIMGLKPFSFLMALILAISEGSDNSRNRR